MGQVAALQEDQGSYEDQESYERPSAVEWLRRNLDLALGYRGAAEVDLLKWIALCDDAEVWREERLGPCGEYLTTAGDDEGPEVRREACAEWLAPTLGVTRWKARRMIAAAHALDRLPSIEEALAHGSLSLDKVVELTRFATPETEKDLVTWARRATPTGVRRRADRECSVAGEDVTQAEEALALNWRQLNDQTVGMEALLPVAEGATVRTAIERRARKLARALAAAGGERRSMEQLRAEALIELAGAHIAADPDPARATVLLHTSSDALLRDEPGSHLAGGSPLHPEVVRRLSCDGRLRVLVHGDDGSLLTSRTSRTISHGLRQAMLERDDHRCTFPGCERRSFLEAHHFEHWAWDGPQELFNLGAACGIHHRYAHEGGWSVALDEHGVVAWYLPNGRRYDPGPAPPWEEDEDNVIILREPKQDEPGSVIATVFSRGPTSGY